MKEMFANLCVDAFGREIAEDGESEPCTLANIHSMLSLFLSLSLSPSLT